MVYFRDAEARGVFYDELTWLCVNQHGAFNSPVWFNVGLYHQYGVGKAQEPAITFTIARLAKRSGAASQYEYPRKRLLHSERGRHMETSCGWR